MHHHHELLLITNKVKRFPSLPVSTVRFAARLKYNMHTFSTLPVEIVYRIMDHQNELTLFCSMQNISRRLNQILSTYERYRGLCLYSFSPPPTPNATPTYHKSGKSISLEGTLKRDIPLQSIAIHSYILLFPHNQLTTLTTLDLGDNRLDAEGAQHIADALRTNTTLTTLNLSWNGIGAEGAKHIADALGTNATLTTLKLCRNGIGAEGAQHIADALRANTTLTTLDIGYNEIGDEVAQRIADALRRNASINMA
ncbi:unnamed protein product [Adineta ricciae]|uniref:F-box domain-containing protein n=1 Tax=Adineta ricciae TaxID=249248 RepID=A0A814PQ31_ADIRI|nr:unnamed protein product [Adineta ricciae]